MPFALKPPCARLAAPPRRRTPVEDKEKELLVKRILTSLTLVVCFAFGALAQDAQDANKEMLKKAAENGKRLHVEVNGNVSAEAVLIPQVDAKRIFGKEIANNYAIVEVNVGNKSPDAALIIHNIYIDYSRWALSGVTGFGGSTTTVDGLERDTMTPYHASNNPNRVASAEYRIVRGQLLDAQPSTRRNRIIKWLSLIGTAAAAYTFSLNEEGIIRGIAAYNGVLVPGIGATFPDHVIPQLNRVSDFGFQTNKVIPKEGGEVIVCFFPIDRFLTPGFRALFLKSPALFFAPLQMLVDEKSKQDMMNALGDDLGLTPNDIGARPTEVQKVLREALPCYLRIVRGESLDSAAGNGTLRGQMDQQLDEVCLGSFGLKKERDKANRLTGKLVRMTDTEAAKVPGVSSVNQLLGRFLALDYLSQASLNNVRVTVDGVMTIDTMAINAKLDGVTFDDVEDCGGADKECFWSVPAGGSAVRTGVIHGAYLTSGNVTIVEAAALHIEDVKSIPEGSSDQELHFTMTLKQDVPSGKNMTFKVTKPRSGAPGTVDSQPWMYAVGFLSNTPTYKVEYDDADNKLNVISLGAPFKDADIDLLTLSLLNPARKPVAVNSKATLDGGKAVFDFPADPPAGCWLAMVKRDKVEIDIVKDKFEVPPGPPTLTKADAVDGLLEVGGDNFVDTSGCDGEALRFQLVEKKDDGSAGKTFELTKVKKGKFVLPDEAKAGTKWVVQVRRGGDPVGDDAKKDLEIK